MKNLIMSFSLLFSLNFAHAELGAGDAVKLIKKGIDSNYELNCIGTDSEFQCFNKKDNTHGLQVSYRQDKNLHSFDIKPISREGAKCYATKSEEEILGEQLVNFVSEQLRTKYLKDDVCELYTDNLAGDFSKYKKTVCKDKTGSSLTMEVFYDSFCGRNVKKITVKVK